MTLHLTRACLLLGLLSACEPSQRCTGELYFDPDTFSCNECPKNTSFENGSCVCNDSNYEFAGNRCMLKDGAMPEPMGGDEDSGVADSGTTTGASRPSCSDYCSFLKGCFADNSLAAVLGDIISGLHADDPEACASSCQADTGGDGTDSAVIACIQNGRQAAMCDDDPSQAGLESGFGLLGDCCGSAKSDPLCISACAPLKASPLTSSMVDFCD